MPYRFDVHAADIDPGCAAAHGIAFSARISYSVRSASSGETRAARRAGR